MLLFGCGVPGGNVGEVFQCASHPTCEGGRQILYGWGRDASALQLPADVGIAVGPGTGLTHLVLQVHYLNGRPADDTAGILLRLDPTPVQLLAGVLVFASLFSLEPGLKEINVS